MIQDYIYIAIFASFPEVIVMLLFGFSLSNFRNVNISKLLIVAFIQTIVAFLVRFFNVYLGVHTIVQIISLYILVVVIFKIKYYKAIIPVLIGMLSQGLIQNITLPLIVNVWQIDITNLYYNPKNLVLAAFHIFIISLILLIIIKRKRFFLCDIND